jgi:hypothetical protein
MPQPLGVVSVLVSGKPTEHRLPQHTDKSVPAVLAGANVGEPLAGQIRKAECVVEFAVGKQPSIGGDDRTAKLKGQSAVVIEPERLAIRFTRRVRHEHQLPNQPILIIISRMVTSSGECGIQSAHSHPST